MWIVALAWMYVVVMMAAAEAMAPNGSVLGAVFTFLLYGLLPLSLVLYILGTPGRKRALQRAEQQRQATSAAAPDGGGQATGDAVAAERKEP